MKNKNKNKNKNNIKLPNLVDKHKINKLYNDSDIPYNAVNSGNIYFSNLLDCYIIDYYINDSLPLNGWFKECIICYMITGNSNYIKYKLDKKKISIPICKNCLNLNTKNFIDFKISDFLNKYNC